MIISPAAILYNSSGTEVATVANPLNVSGSLSTTQLSPTYAATTGSLTITLASLATAGARASTVVDNTTTKFDDILFFVTLKTGGTGVTTTGYVNIFGYGSIGGVATYPENITGADAAATLTSPPNLPLLTQVNTVAVSTTYKAGPFSFCRLYGLDRLPPKWGLVVQNQSGGAFDATGTNFSINYQGVNGKLI